MQTMTKNFLLIICVLFTMSWTAEAQQPALVQNGKTNYQIVIPSSASNIEKRAADELRNYIQQATGASLSVVSETAARSSNRIEVGNTKAAQALGIMKNVRNDGFAIQAKNGSVYIAGGGEKGTLYGANAFLETFLGIDYLSASVIYVPKTTTVTLPQTINIVSNPAFVTRDNFTDMGFNGKWNGIAKDYSGGYKDWHRINHVFSNWDKESNWGLFGHTFFTLVPPKTYFATHPEYYSLVNGKRQAQQLNLSNPKVAEIVIAQLKKLMQASPSKTYWMVGQEDMGVFCQCNDCQRAYRKYGGNESGLMIEFVNQIARAFPDKQIATFAYKQTEAPPQNITPEANVIVVSAPIKAHHNVPLDSKENNPYNEYIRQWGKLTHNQMIWDYYANFNDIITPYPNLAMIAPNFRFYQSVGAQHVFAQRPVFLNGSEMEELKAYLISKMLWNPSLDARIRLSSLLPKNIMEMRANTSCNTSMRSTATLQNRAA